MSRVSPPATTCSTWPDSTAWRRARRSSASKSRTTRAARRNGGAQLLACHQGGHAEHHRLARFLGTHPRNAIRRLGEANHGHVAAPAQLELADRLILLARQG